MARVTHRSLSYPLSVPLSQRTAVLSTWPAVHAHARGMHPPPQDAQKLYRECTRLAWAIHCHLASRAKLAVLLDRSDVKLHAWRRQHDEYSAALEALSPELHARAEERRRDYDDPLKALKWAQRGHDDEVL